MSAETPPAPPVQQSRTRRGEWAVLIVVSAIKLWLVDAWSLAATGWAAHDDRWFLVAAQSILKGEWLGKYSEMTLIKGAGYPLLIAFTSILGVPLLLAQQVLYVIACIAVYGAVAPRVRSGAARTALFVVLVLNPMTFASEVATRVSREAVYPALTLLVVAGVVGTLFRLDLRRRILPWTILGGAALALFWHTREEGVWLAPLLFFCAVALASWVMVDWRQRLRRALLVVALPASIFAAAYAAIVITNALRYGVYTTVEFKEKSFLRAYGALASVRQHPTVARVPVPRAVRETVYQVSPAFAELRPYLEGQVGASWTNVSSPYTKDEIGGGWFMWAFREAVAAAGYYSRGSAAVAEYHERLAREVEAARVAGRLDARRNRESMLPALMAGERSAVAMTWLQGWVALLKFEGFTTHRTYSEGSDRDLLEFANVTRTRLAPRQSEEPIMRLHASGTIADGRGPITIALERGDGSSSSDAKVVQAEPVRQHNGGFTRTFELWSPVPDIWMVLALDGKKIRRVPLTYDLAGVDGEGTRLVVKSIALEAVEERLSSSAAFRRRIMERIGGLYQFLFAPIAVLVILLYLMNLVRLVKERHSRELLFVVIGICGAIAARLLILALIDVTSFPAMVGPYQGAAHALLILGTVLMGYQAVGAIALRRRKR